MQTGGFLLRVRRWRAGDAGQLARPGDLYLKQGDRLKSRGAYQQSLRLDPSNRELRELLAKETR